MLLANFISIDKITLLRLSEFESMGIDDPTLFAHPHIFYTNKGLFQRCKSIEVNPNYIRDLAPKEGLERS